MSPWTSHSRAVFTKLAWYFRLSAAFSALESLTVRVAAPWRKSTVGQSKSVDAWVWLGAAARGWPESPVNQPLTRLVKEVLVGALAVAVGGGGAGGGCGGGIDV